MGESGVDNPEHGGNYLDEEERGRERKREKEREKQREKRRKRKEKTSHALVLAGESDCPIVMYCSCTTVESDTRPRSN